MNEVLRDLREPHPDAAAAAGRRRQRQDHRRRDRAASPRSMPAAQAAVMAPTEILAEQHWRKFRDWLAPLGVRVAWLHGGYARRSERQARCCDGARSSIGTHALFQKGVEFARLGLVGRRRAAPLRREQRLALRKKASRRGAGVVPHQLMMSATPIPRTLAMTYFADLDVSTIDELPPGRRAGDHAVFFGDRRERSADAHPRGLRRGRSRRTGCAR